MAKWTVQMEIHAYQEVEVEADSCAEAEEAAKELADLYECCSDFKVEIMDSWTDDEEEDEDDYCVDCMDDEAECDSCDCDTCPHYVG